MSDMTVVGELEALLTDQPTNPLRPNQAHDWQAEIDRLERMTTQPNEFAGSARGFARRRLLQIRRLVDTQAPKKIPESPRRAQVSTLCRRVLTEVMLPRLLTRSESNRNPPGAVGHQLKDGEFSKPFKRAAMVWKRGMRALDPDNPDPDYTNYARYQREGIRNDGAGSFVVDAQVPGNFAMSPLAKANWPFDDTGVQSAVNEVKARESNERTPPPTPSRRGGSSLTIGCRFCEKTFRGPAGFAQGNVRRHEQKVHPESVAHPGHALREESADASLASP